ncbi:BQ2448_636 [Microbotryum intermedium]|uniref:BQ2448_636 protein n=1 Tax=Microbotryum intermedium TaxID=269621 RepID=A0A238F5U9_9BASI|nr:BQ2448_636 [Microbotryum intermedium]
MYFVSLLSRLNSSLPSIQKVALFALKHTPRCSLDIWECLVEEVTQANLNARVNLLHLIDAILEKDSIVGSGTWSVLVVRNLKEFVVDGVVGDTREGRINLMSAHQVLKSWRMRRLLDVDVLDEVLKQLDMKKEALTTNDTESNEPISLSLSRNDILRRIEDDRERVRRIHSPCLTTIDRKLISLRSGLGQFQHKRLRERIWVLPIPTSLFILPTPTTNPTLSNLNSIKPSPISPASPSEPPPSRSHKVNASSSTSAPSAVGAAVQRGPEVPIHLEFEQTWARLNEEREFAKMARRDGEGDGAAQEEAEVSKADGEGRERKKRKIEGDQMMDEENGTTKWPFDESERRAMRIEYERCFL